MATTMERTAAASNDSRLCSTDVLPSVDAPGNARRQASLLWGPRAIDPGVPLLLDPTTVQPRLFEISLHTLPKTLQREFHHVFPMDLFLDTVASPNLEFLALCTNQQAIVDLVGIGDDVEHEKDVLLNLFMSFAQRLCARLQQLGYWADFIDPCSGLPMLSSTQASKVYSEVDGMECCLHYRSHNAGCCKVLLHPVWGSRVYPATIFTRAPRTVVLRLLDHTVSTNL